MAHNIARAGIPLRAWNRRPQRAMGLEADGATVPQTPAQAATGAEVVITMLSDAGIVLTTMDGEDGALGAMVE